MRQEDYMTDKMVDVGGRRFLVEFSDVYTNVVLRRWSS